MEERVELTAYQRTKKTKSFTSHVSPSVLVGKLIVVEVLEVIPTFCTKHAPEGKPAIRLNVTEIITSNQWNNIIWLNSVLVDGFAPFVGRHVVVQIVEKPSKVSGYTYLTLQEPSEDEMLQAKIFHTTQTHNQPSGVSEMSTPCES